MLWREAAVRHARRVTVDACRLTAEVVRWQVRRRVYAERIFAQRAAEAGWSDCVNGGSRVMTWCAALAYPTTIFSLRKQASCGRRRSRRHRHAGISTHHERAYRLGYCPLVNLRRVHAKLLSSDHARLPSHLLRRSHLSRIYLTRHLSIATTVSLNAIVSKANLGGDERRCLLLLRRALLLGGLLLTLMLVILIPINILSAMVLMLSVMI